MEIGKNKLHLMLLQLKIDSAMSIGENLQYIMSKEYVWETGKEMSYFTLFLPELRNCVCRAMGETVSGRPAGPPPQSSRLVPGGLVRNLWWQSRH
jgi:hypothetical protein